MARKSYLRRPALRHFACTGTTESVGQSVCSQGDRHQPSTRRITAPSDSALVLVGDVTLKDEATKLAEKYFGKLDGFQLAVAPTIPPAPVAHDRNARRHHRQAQRTANGAVRRTVLAFRIMYARQPHAIESDELHVLGGAFASAAST